LHISFLLEEWKHVDSENDLAGDASYFVTIYSVHHVQFFPLHECVLIDFESVYARFPCPVVPIQLLLRFFSSGPE
jgi:hypothetical protein